MPLLVSLFIVITVIISTNRRESTTSRVAALIAKLLQKENHPVQILDLAELPTDFFRPSMYDERSADFIDLFNRYIEPADHLVFVIPEYNGSYPGVLKMFIDASPVKSFWNKRASIIGLSDGHAGNMRGQEHLTGVLHYLKMHVHYHKPKLSGITRSFDTEGHLTDQRYQSQLEEHAKMIVEFLGK